MKPEPRLLGALAALAGLALAASFRHALIPAVLAGFVALLLFVVFDAWRGFRLPAVAVRRTVPGALALGSWIDVSLELESPTSAPLNVELYDHHPATGEISGLPRRVDIVPDAAVSLGYRFRPLRRGGARFGIVELLILSPARLWRIRRRIDISTDVKVFPDFRSVQRYAILALDNARGLLGIRKRQRRGEGLELRQLREYRDGDALRQIDWKATSRRDRVISREYEDERNQQVVFMLDCGWRMRAIDDGEVHFDRALNSVLLLTYVALRQGDAVGLLTMAGRRRWLPPQHGPGAMGSMLDAVYDLETQGTHPDFTKAATELMARQSRRALIVIVSNLRDEDSDEAIAAVQLMRRRHLVLFASLREASLDRAVEAPIDDFRTAVRTAATHHFLTDRRKAHERLRGRGVSILDVTPAGLPAAMVNRYLDIKGSGML